MEEVKSEPHYQKEATNGIAKDVTNLVETYIDIAKANVTQKAANVASMSISGILMVFLGIFCLFFAGAGLAWWIGELLDNMVAGFLIVSGIFALLLVLLIAFKEKLLYPIIRNSVVRKVYEQ